MASVSQAEVAVFLENFSSTNRVAQKEVSEGNVKAAIYKLSEGQQLIAQMIGRILTNGP